MRNWSKKQARCWLKLPTRRRRERDEARTRSTATAQTARYLQKTAQCVTLRSATGPRSSGISALHISCCSAISSTAESKSQNLTGSCRCLLKPCYRNSTGVFRCPSKRPDRHYHSRWFQIRAMNRHWCCICGAGFETAGGLRRHLRNVHSEDTVTDHSFRAIRYSHNGQPRTGNCAICYRPAQLHMRGEHGDS